MLCVPPLRLLSKLFNPKMRTPLVLGYKFSTIEIYNFEQFSTTLINESIVANPIIDKHKIKSNIEFYKK